MDAWMLGWFKWLDIKMAAAILGMLPMIYKIGKRFVELDEKHDELKKTMEELRSKVKDMDKEVTKEEERPGKKRKSMTDAYFRQAKRYNESAEGVLGRSQGGQWKVKRMMWMPCIERHQKEGGELLSKGSQLLQKGLTYGEIRTRGVKLPLGDQYMLETTCRLIESALKNIKGGVAQCIGIYGSVGAGKTNLMKYLYNEVFEDKDFKAVFWATAPEAGKPDQRNYNKSLQERVADGMWIDLDNNYQNEVTRAARIMERLREIGQGRGVLFLDNVREEFSAYELLGLPTLHRGSNNTSTDTESDAGCSLNCILVFTTLSKEICNRMRCDSTHKMDQLDKSEAQKLFLHEVRHGDDPPQVHSNQEQKIQKLAIQVADQCARMPLPIIFIARSMAGIKNPWEWRNRLNELKDTIGSIHEDEEAKILEHLKFGYLSLKDETVKLCFQAAASLLADDSQVCKLNIIHKWKSSGLIGKDQGNEFAVDQGHAILNQLDRMCLLQIAPDHQTVTMNKWIWKMAKKVTAESGSSSSQLLTEMAM